MADDDNVVAATSFLYFFDDDVIAVDKNEQQWVCSMELVVLVYWTIWFNVPVKPSSAAKSLHAAAFFSASLYALLLDWYKIGRLLTDFTNFSLSIAKFSLIFSTA